MKNVVQPARGGPVTVLDVSRPVPGPTGMLAATVAAVISADIERAATALVQSSLLAKARAGLVRQVARTAGGAGRGAGHGRGVRHGRPARAAAG